MSQTLAESGKILLVITLLTASLGMASPASAQVLSPGQVLETLKPAAAPPSVDKPALEIKTTPPRSEDTAPTDERRVRVTRFEFNGNTVFDAARLREVVSELEGRELTLSEIYAAADRLTDFYQSMGYSLTTVTVPAQKMRDGNLQLEIVEGRVGRLLIKGNERYSPEFINWQLDLVTPGSIIRFQELEQEVLLLNDLPGMLARSVLLPGEHYGTSDIQLTVEETMATGQLVIDNHGRREIGSIRAGADFNINNPGGIGDLLSLGYTHTEAGLLRQGRISYGVPVHPSGSRLSMSYSRAEYDVGGEFSRLAIAGSSETARLQLSQPLLRGRRTNFAWLAGAAHIKGQSEMSDLPINDDEINFMETGLTFNKRHDAGGISNLNGMLASNLRSNGDGSRSDALLLRLEIKGSYEHPLPADWSALLRGETVLSPDPLPDANKFSLGGPASVRGFISSHTRGDQGAMGSIELRRVLRLSPFDLQLRGFLDTGLTTRHSTPGQPKTTSSLTSAGLGLSATLPNQLILDLQWARPLDSNPSGEGDNARLWLSLTTTFSTGGEK